MAIEDFLPEDELLEIDDEGNVVEELTTTTPTEEAPNKPSERVQEIADTVAPVGEEVEIEEEEELPPVEEETVDVPTEEASDGNAYFAFAKMLHEKGILGGIEEERLSEITDDETLADVYASQVEGHANQLVSNYVGSLNEKAQGLFDHLANGGNVSDFVDTYSKVENFDVNEEQLKESEELQKQVLTQYYKETAPRWSDSKIKRLVDDELDLEGESLEALKGLQAIKKEKEESLAEQTKAQQAEMARRDQELRDNFKENFYGMTEFIPGKKLTKKQQDNIFGEKGEAVDNVIQKISQEKEKYYPMLVLLDHYGLLDGKFDKLVNVKKSKVSSELSNLLNKSGKAAFQKVTKDESHEELVKAAKGYIDMARKK